jgi:cyclopropane fatty-acyl-phospholipid synthase-like methyltransferase
MSTHSAAAERNKGPILDVLMPLLQPGHSLLEVASGTGQHVTHFAAAIPSVEFQPTERDDTGLAELVVALLSAPLPNVRSPLVLDVESAWPALPAFDLVLCINMIHIAPWSATAALFDGAARVLRRDKPGKVLLYGPYKEGGVHTAPSNEEFDAWLRQRDARSGVRDLEAVCDVASQHGFARDLLVRMPANNLCVGFSRVPGRSAL